MIGLVHESSMKVINTCSSNPEQPQSLETKQRSIVSDGKFACSTKDSLSINSTAPSNERNIKGAGLVSKHSVINWREMGAFRCEECSFTTTDESIFQAHKAICRKRKRPSLENSYGIIATATKISKKSKTESLSNDLRANGSSLPLHDSINTKSTTFASASDCRAIKPKTGPDYKTYQITSDPSLMQLVSGPQTSPLKQPIQMMFGQQGLSVMQGLHPVLVQQQIPQVSPKQPIQLISGQQTDARAHGLQLLPLSSGSVTSNPSQLQFSGQQSMQVTSGKQVIPGIMALKPFSGSPASGKFVTESAPISASQSGACQAQNYYVQPVILMPVGDASNDQSGEVDSMMTTLSQAIETKSSLLNASASLNLQSGSAVSTIEWNAVANACKSSDSENSSLPKIVSTVSLAGVDHSFFNDETPVRKSSIISDVIKEAFEENDSDYYTAVSVKYIQNDKTVEMILTRTQRHFLCNMCKIKTQRICLFQSHLHDHIHGAKICEKCTTESTVEDCTVLSDIMKRLLSHKMEHKQPRSTTPSEHMSESIAIVDSSSNTDDKMSKTFEQRQLMKPNFGECNKNVENEIESEFSLKKPRQECLVNRSSPKTSSTSRIIDPMIAENDVAGSFYKCAFDSCQFSSLNSSKFLNHLLVKHRSDKCFPCAHCSVACKDGNSLIQHMSCHVRCKRFILYQCAAKSLSCVSGNGINVCGFGTNDLSQFILHVQVHHGKDPNYNCAKCGSVLDSAELLRDHLQANLLKFIQCPYCSAKNKNRRVIQQHIGSEHSGKAKHIRVTSELACCRKERDAIAIKNIKASATSAESSDTETTECAMSEKIADKDMNPSNKSGYKKMRCTVKKREAQQMQGQSPVLENIQDKRFVCSSCIAATYENYSSLKSHIYQEHLQNGDFDCMNVLLYKCDRCEYRSTSKHNVGRHVSQAHGTDDILILKQNIKISQADCLSDLTMVELNSSDNSEEVLNELVTLQNIDKHDNCKQGPPEKIKEENDCYDAELVDENDNSEVTLDCSVLQRNKMQAYLNSSDTPCDDLTELATNVTPTEVYEHNNNVKQIVPPVTKCFPQIQPEIVKNILPISQNYDDSADGVDSVTSLPNRINSTQDIVSTESHPSFGANGLDFYMKDCYSIQSTGHYGCLFCKYITNRKIAMHKHLMGGKHLDMHLYRCGLCQFKCLIKSGITKHSQKRHMAETVILLIEQEPLTNLIAEYRKKFDGLSNTNHQGTDAMIDGVSNLKPEDGDGGGQEQLSHLNSKIKTANLENERNGELNKKWRVKLVLKNNSLSSDVNAEVSDQETKHESPNEQNTEADQRDDDIVTDIPELCIKRER